MYIPTPDELAMDSAPTSLDSTLDATLEIAGRPEFGPTLPADLPPSWKDIIWGNNDVETPSPLAFSKPAPLSLSKPAQKPAAATPIAETSAAHTSAVPTPVVPTPAPTVGEVKPGEEEISEGEGVTKGEEGKEKNDAPVSGPDLPPLPASWKERIWGPTTSTTTISTTSQALPQLTPATAEQKATYISALRRALEYKPSGLKAHLSGHGTGDWVQKEKLRATIRNLLRKQGMSLELQLAMEGAAKEAGVEFSAGEAKEMLWDVMDGLRDEKVDREPWIFGGDVDKVSRGWDLREAQKIIKEAEEEEEKRRA